MPQMTNRYLSLLAELRRSIEGLGISGAVILERGLRISRGGLLYAGAGEMADWLGDDDRRSAQRIRRTLIERGLLIAQEQRHRENGADSVLVCRFADAVLAIYRRWHDARHATTECRRADDKLSPALESEAKREEIQDLKTKRDSVRLTPPPAPEPAQPRQKRPTRPVEGANPFARRLWLRTLNSFIGERLSGPQQWSGWDLVARAEAGTLIERAERRRLDDIDRAMRGCGYRATLASSADSACQPAAAE